MAGDELQAATAEAESSLAEALRKEESLDPLYAQLDDVIADLTAQGCKPSDLLPVDAEPGIGFSLNEKRDGRTLWQAIAGAGRSSICDPAGDLHRRLVGGAEVSAGALLTAVMATLGLPLMAAAVGASIVAVILAFGIQGFCEWSAAPPDEPAAP